MKIIFYIYCFSYVIISLLMSYWVTDVFTSKLLASFSILIMGFVCLAPIIVLINPSIIKSSESDPKYMNFCFVAGFLRFVFWAISIIGLRDHTILLFLNAFGLSIFALIQSKFNMISNEYFKY